MLDAYGRARNLLGTPFRPQGRDPATGLDCIGLVLLSYEIPAATVPPYRLSDGDWSVIEQHLFARFLMRGDGKHRAGDLMVSRLQRSFHFGVLGPASVIHSDLRIGRVVETPLGSEAGESRIYRYSRM